MKICWYFNDDNNYNNSITTSPFYLVMCAVCIMNELAKIIRLPKTMLLIQNLYTLLRLILPVLQTQALIIPQQLNILPGFRNFSKQNLRSHFHTVYHSMKIQDGQNLPSDIFSYCCFLVDLNSIFLNHVKYFNSPRLNLLPQSSIGFFHCFFCFKHCKLINSWLDE